MTEEPKYYRTAKEYLNYMYPIQGAPLEKHKFSGEKMVKHMNSFASEFGRYKLDMFIKVLEHYNIDISRVPQSLLRHPEFIDIVEPTEHEIGWIKNVLRQMKEDENTP